MRTMSKTAFTAGLMAIALGVAAPAAVARAQAFDAAAAQRPAQPFHIAGDLYYVGMAGVGAYLIATPKGHILIDGGFESSAPLVLANIRALGFQPRDVKVLLITHAHYDHAGGLAALKRATGARLLALAAEKPALEQGRHFGDNENGVGRFPAVKVDQAIADGEVIRLGGAAVTAHWTPGHTIGCTSFTHAVIDGGRMHTAVVYGSTTVAGNALVANHAYPGIVADYRKSFVRLAAIHADIFLANHPSFAHLDEKRARVAAAHPNPFIDAAELQRFVAGQERAFNAELARQQGRARPARR
jgi:metallo-beta-lactamase class B